jgi:hypothetical protein
MCTTGMRVGATTAMSLLLLLSIGNVVSCGFPPSTTAVAPSSWWWNAVHSDSWWWCTKNRTAAATATPAGNDSITLIHPVEDNHNDSPRWSICSWWPFVGAPPKSPQCNKESTIPNDSNKNAPRTMQDDKPHRLESVRASTTSLPWFVSCGESLCQELQNPTSPLSQIIALFGCNLASQPTLVPPNSRRHDIHSLDSSQCAEPSRHCQCLCQSYHCPSGHGHDCAESFANGRTKPPSSRIWWWAIRAATATDSSGET